MSNITNKKIVNYLSIFVAFVVFVVFSPKANAQQNTISVSPSIVQLDLQTDAPQTTLTYTNNTNLPTTLSFSANDFNQLEGAYTISFFQGKNQYAYGLASYISFSTTTLSLAPHQKGDITLFLQQHKLTPGGHYASILATVQQTSPENGQVQIHSGLSSLLFVRTNTGREIETARITYIRPLQNFFDFPKIIVLRFNNTGDTHLIPYGLVRITNMFGQEVAKAVVNDASSIALPQSIRSYEVQLQPNTWLLMPGIYTLHTALHYGKTNQKLLSTTTFFSFGSFPILPLLVLFVFLTIFFFLKRKNK